MLVKENKDEMQVPVQRAVLVALNDDRGDIRIEDSVEELKELALAAHAEVMDILVQNKAGIDVRYYIGKGKVEEVRLSCEFHDANLVIFNDELSGAQIRNLEEALDVRVIDRTALILDIFAHRARTKAAKLQVELAQLRYRLPRLKGVGESLSRTGAGIGTRGPGEQKLEIDRRRINERISDIRSQLKDIHKVRETQKSRRVKKEIPLVAVVGYTNAGKSTFINTMLDMTHSHEEVEEDKKVFVKDMLFATLDTFSRRINLSENKEFIIVDTVGFVSKLPHALVEAFKATLEEVIDADLLLHVVDASNENYDMQINVTNRVLKELGVHDKPSIIVFNKMDKLDDEVVVPRMEDSHLLSASTGEGMEDLIQRLDKELFSDILRVKFLIPYDKGSILSSLCDDNPVISTDYTETGTLVELEVKQKDYNKYKAYVVSE